MIATATRAGFVREGTLRRSAWVDGTFADEAILGMLAFEWSQPRLLTPQIGVPGA